MSVNNNIAVDALINGGKKLLGSNFITNLWDKYTGAAAAKEQTQMALGESARQFNENLQFQKDLYDSEINWQQEQFGKQLDFANRNLDLNSEIANSNLALQQSAFDYQKQLNATQMEREDSAMQRQIADLQASGFSPLAALGGSGSSSTPLSSGNAPQMDFSGVNQASGAYLDMARQYASLHSQATQNYMNGRNQAAIQHNSQVLGARTALAQMKADLHFKGQNMATQYFNAAVNASNARLQRDYMREQIQTKKYENDWYKNHGYQRMTVAQVLSDIFNRDSTQKVLSHIENGYDKLAGALDNLAQKVPDSANIKFNYSDVYSEFKKQGLSDSDSKIMADNVEQMYEEWNKKPFWEKTHESWKSFINESKLKIKNYFSR